MNPILFFFLICLTGWETATIHMVSTDPEFSDVWATFKLFNIMGMLLIILCFTAFPKEFIFISIFMTFMAAVVCIGKSEDSFYTIFKNRNNFTF